MRVIGLDRDGGRGEIVGFTEAVADEDLPRVGLPIGVPRDTFCYLPESGIQDIIVRPALAVAHPEGLAGLGLHPGAERRERNR